jgi:hypothetical protein
MNTQTAPGQQVITIRPDGSLQGLQMKPGKGLDLREFGRAQIERASEVMFCPDRQRWYVEFREGPLTAKPLTVSLLVKARGEVGAEHEPEAVAYFDEYDDAVQGEIDALNYVRLNAGAVEGSSASV